MPKTKREIAREVDEFLAYSKYPGLTSKRPWPPPGVTYGTQWPTDRRYKLVNADTGKDLRDALDFEVEQIHASRHGVIPLVLRGGTYQVRLRDPDGEVRGDSAVAAHWQCANSNPRVVFAGTSDK
jgi:hypothetical protein